MIIVRKKKSRKSTESERTLDSVQHNKFHAFLILEKVFTTKAANKDKEYM